MKGTNEGRKDIRNNEIRMEGEKTGKEVRKVEGKQVRKDEGRKVIIEAGEKRRAVCCQINIKKVSLLICQREGCCTGSR